MTAAETIQAAIDKLTRLRDLSTQDKWVRDVAEAEATPGLMRAVVLDDLTDVDATLVITLHATIDAQLAILQRSLDWFTEEAMSYIGPEDMALARAILGEQVDA